MTNTCRGPVHKFVIHLCFSVHRLQQHGNAVNLKGVYEDSHNVYIVMEECRGGDLEQLMDVRDLILHAFCGICLCGSYCYVLPR